MLNDIVVKVNVFLKPAKIWHMFVAHIVLFAILAYYI